MADNGKVEVSSSGSTAPSETSADALADSVKAMKLKKIEDDVASSFVLVDIGANLTSSKYARDLDSVLERAKDAGIQFHYYFQIACYGTHFYQLFYITGVRKIMVTGASVQ